jgi:glycosyltransferase involved in cell wall biosynthesis
MKILLIGPVYPYRGGIAHFTTSLVLKLQKKGYEVQLISFKRQYPKWLFPGKSDKDLGPGRMRVQTDYLLSPLDPLSWWKTFNAIKRFQPDMVILQWWITYWALAIGFLTRRLRDAHYSYKIIIHNSLPHEPRFFDPILVRYALSPSKEFLVMNDQEQSRMEPLLFGRHIYHHCPLPVFSVFPEVAHTRKDARVELGLPLDKKLILFFGIVRPYKGLIDLLSAVSILKKEGQNVGLVVAGEFWDDKQAYLDQIQDLLIADNTWLMDRYISDEETALVFKAANLFVAPYQGATQSATLKTALGFGIPMVVTTCVADDLVKALPTHCRITPVAEPVTLARNIMDMIDRPSLSSQAIDRINDQSWSRMINVLAAQDARAGGSPR